MPELLKKLMSFATWPYASASPAHEIGFTAHETVRCLAVTRTTAPCYSVGSSVDARCASSSTQKLIGGFGRLPRVLEGLERERSRVPVGEGKYEAASTPDTDRIGL